MPADASAENLCISPSRLKPEKAKSANIGAHDGGASQQYYPYFVVLIVWLYR